MNKWNPDICIYHGNCDDGFGAAWAIWTMWPECEFVPGFYGMDLPNVDGKNVLFVDFSAKRPLIDAIAQTAKTIVIIDHHKTAEADLEPFKVTMCGSAVLNPHDIQHMFRDLAELDRPPIIAWFDTEQSGAVMAWQFAQGDHRDEGYIPLMLELIEDRDLWRFSRGDTTREFSAALRTYPMDFKVWDEISENPRDLYAEGKVILRAHRANIEKLMREAYTETISGFAVPVVNAPYHYASDTAHELLTAYPDAPFAACWFRRADGQIQWSLRSEDHRQDVSEIAKGFGGGGHRNAAGFQSPAAPPQTNLVGEDEANKAAFNHGYVLACCNIANLHDEPGVAFDVLCELGVTKAEVKAIGLSEYDTKALRKIEQARGNRSLYSEAKVAAPPSPQTNLRVPVAWRWRFEPDGSWSYGTEKPSGFRFGEPEVIEPLFADVGNGR